MTQAMPMMLAALGAEILLLLFVLLSVSWWRNRAARRRDGAAIQALVARIKGGRAEREAAIERFLTGAMAMSGEAVTQAKVSIIRAEFGLLQRFAGLYRKRDAAAAARFDADLFAALETYHALQAAADAGAAQVAMGDPVDSEELEALRAENLRLSDELRVTMDTMSRMLNEYSNMFAGAAPPEAAPIAELVGGAAVASQAESGDPTGAEVAVAELDAQPVQDPVDVPAQPAIDLVAGASPGPNAVSTAPVDDPLAVGAGNDPLAGMETFAEGPAEVMVFDEDDDSGVEMVVGDDGLLDSAESADGDDADIGSDRTARSHDEDSTTLEEEPTDDAAQPFKRHSGG